MSKSLVGVVAVLAVIVLSGYDLFKGQQPYGPAVQEVSVVLKEWQDHPGAADGQGRQGTLCRQERRDNRSRL
jgi:hypothetical protein